jgi:hypothetical protein
MNAYQPQEGAEAQRYGVAVGIETNVGTLWAQEPGDNKTVDWK